MLYNYLKLMYVSADTIYVKTSNKLISEKFDQNLNYFEVEHITTLRNSYSQRI